MIECELEIDPINGNHYVNGVNHSLRCFEGSHWIHFSFCIVIMLMFIIVCLIVTLTYYEYNEKINSRADTFVLLSKIIHVLFFALSQDPNNNWILILFQFVMSIWMVSKYITEKPYIERHKQKVKEIIWGIYTWSTFLCGITFVNNNLLILTS